MRCRIYAAAVVSALLTVGSICIGLFFFGRCALYSRPLCRGASHINTHCAQICFPQKGLQ